MYEWRNLSTRLDSELAMVDIADVNLACAADLPGSDIIDFDFCRWQLGMWAQCVRQFTERAMPLFYSGRSDYPDSEPRFRIQALITCLQRDLGIRYRFDRRGESAAFEPADSFLLGIIQGQGGTCASLPVLYVAIGRRLGYPLKLATTRRHLYVRWEARPESQSFNIEASGDGVSFFPDEYYCTGRYDMTPDMIRECGYMKALSPREELADFLIQRGCCWMRKKEYREAATSFAWANELDPGRIQHAWLVGQAMQQWEEELRAQLPPAGFPILDIALPPREFSNMPGEWERELVRMRVMQGLLRDPDYQRRWWKPLRINSHQRPPGLPSRLPVEFRWNNPANLLAQKT